MTTKKENKREAILLVGSSEQDANMYWATKFKQLDPFIFIQTNNEKILITNGLEFDRAKQEAKVDRVMNIEAFGKKKGIKTFA